MYLDFDPADRAQGIPPGARTLSATGWTHPRRDCLNVIAWDGDEVAGHATLVPDGDAYELAIFVHQTYQRAGIGTRLIKALLGHGRRPAWRRCGSRSSGGTARRSASTRPSASRRATPRASSWR